MSNRILAAFAYLPVLGWLPALVHASPLLRHHARQGAVLVGIALASLVLWAVLGWLLALIPYVGALLAAAAFALVVAVFFYLLICTGQGVAAALRGYRDTLPLTRRWMGRADPAA